jgi:murein L,D-transpeptidase YcbB/YkuD
MRQDITGILNEWSFDPEANVRKIAGEDGVEKIQVRVDQGAFQGILQLNLDGRPDGRRPHGQDFALDHYRGTLEQHRHQHETEDEGFALDGQACKELFDEGARVYERYAFLLQLKDYQRVVRDTERNMTLFSFVNRYAEQQQDRDNLERWWPYILRINGMAKAMLAVDDDDYDRALDIVHQTGDQIGSWPEVEAEEFFVERERSEAALEELEQELMQKRPLSHQEQLERSLQEAIDSEEFERAAVLRDEIAKLQREES